MRKAIEVTVFNMCWCLEDDGSLHVTMSNGATVMFTDGTYLYHLPSIGEAVEANKALFMRDKYDTWFILYYKTQDNVKSCADIESEMMPLMRQCLRETADAINDYLEGDNIENKLKEVNDADKGSVELS